MLIPATHAYSRSPLVKGAMGTNLLPVIAPKSHIPASTMGGTYKPKKSPFYCTLARQLCDNTIFQDGSSTLTNHSSRLMKTNNCVVRGVLGDKRLFLKEWEELSKTRKPPPCIRKCPVALLFIHRGCLRKWDLTGKFVSFDHVCTNDLWDHLSLLAVQVCVVSLDSSSVFAVVPKHTQPTCWIANDVHFHIP